MKIDELYTQLLFITVPIEVLSKTRTSTDTGFIVSMKGPDDKNMPFLIASYHTFVDSSEFYLTFKIKNDTDSITDTVKLKVQGYDIDKDKLGDLDAVAIPIGLMLNGLRKTNVMPYYKSIGEEVFPAEDEIQKLSAVEDVIFIGYPEGILDQKNKLAVIKKGITATPIWNTISGKDEFLIDAGIYQGSSGSPVFLANNGLYVEDDKVKVGDRLWFVGMISGTNNSINATMHLGSVINCKTIINELRIKFENIVKNEEENKTEH